MFATHDEKFFYKECRIAYLKLCPVPSNSISPEVETWKSKISKNFNAELCSKFVASNLLATEHISNKKYRPVLEAFKKCTKICGVQADKNLDDKQ